MADVKYTVVKGDTLTKIAKQYNTTVNELVKLNNIADPNYIVVGQVLTISGTSTTTPTNTTSMAIVNVFGIQSNTDRTVYATWTWDKENTENYQVKWYYDTGDNVWFVGSESTVSVKQATYGAPTNALRVRFVVKPISKTRTVNNKETSYWTASWSTEKIYAFSSNPPTTPPVPTVSIEDYKLTASLSNLDVNATEIQFQIVKNDSTVFNTGKATIITNSASYSCTVAAGNEYKVRCRAVRDTLYSEWSEYSGNNSTIPSAPSAILACRASSDTSVYLEWEAVANAKTYEIQYTTNKQYFDGSDKVSSVSSVEFTHYEKTGLTAGEEYFFRVRAVNDKGNSGWSEIRSTVIGKNPAAPTTWSSTTTTITGEPLKLYWVHNAEDGSSQTYAELELIIGGYKETHTIKNSTDEAEKDKTSVYSIDTSEYPEGTKIQWRVRTAGVTKVYGDWSTQRTIDIYAPPTLELSVTDSSASDFEVLSSFPFYVRALAGPNTQVPIGYHLVVSANEPYETVDNLGNPKNVNAGEQVYSKYFDTDEVLMVELSANNIDLENNINYTVVCTVHMDSGLNAEASTEFRVAWTEEQCEPTAEIGIDPDTYSAYIRPYCQDSNRQLIDDIFLSVYRRDYDGRFTEIATNLDNTKNTFVTDPHPALDFARYRIVATSKTTGAVSFSDIPGVPVGGKGIVIQWDEAWSSFESLNKDAYETPAWSGSMLKLPYNVDVSSNNKPDVELVEYIGRQHPVSYYGTHLGTTESWNTVVPKSDKETLYALDRLSIWRGDVYVRESSGHGYWANITVSFSKKHLELTVPVAISVTRVEGGM